MSYSALHKVLHRLALGSRTIGEVSFQIDQMLARSDGEAVRGGSHVFVCGYARAGTTALMRRLHDTGAFRSLTYADMPFVLAPRLWHKIRGGARAAARPEERAHGDGIMVDTSSPEGLEEVFWRVFAEEQYLKPDHLIAHDVDGEVIAAFRSYVAALLGDGPSRYLSKNNNSILRLPVLLRAFPNATILVPVRAPISHARSLHTQHQRFIARHAEDRFSRDYMTWLGHHEFGADHRPFLLDPAGSVPNPGAADDVSYWLDRWIEVYGWLTANAPERCRFICYEDLCTDPLVWERLAADLDLPTTNAGASFAIGRSPPDESDLSGLKIAQATEIFESLRALAR